MSQPPDPNWFDPPTGSGEQTPAPPGAGYPGGGYPDGGYPGGGYPGGGYPGGYGGYPGPAHGYGGAPLIAGPAPVQVSFAPSGRQSRLTIAFRIILIIPHAFALWALGIAAGVIVFIGWFAALFTGTLPEWAHTFLTGVLRWQTRVYAYEFLLTDAYPPFSLEDEPYAVRLVTGRTRLNRAAVLFRIFLAIPVAIVTALVTIGLGVLSFFLWLIALVAGRLPSSVHQAVAAVVRYQARYGGFYYLLTGEYPKGLLGDGGAPVAPAPVVVPAGPSGTAEPFGAESTTAVLAPPDQPAPASDPWRLTLTSTARNLVVAFLVLGALGVIAYVVVLVTVVGSAANNVTNTAALNSIRHSEAALGTSVSRFPSQVEACAGKLTCVTAADRGLAATIDAFAGAVRSAGFTGTAAADANSLVSEATAAARSLDQLGSATSVSQYESDATGNPLQQQLDAMSADYLRLLKDAGGH